MKLDKTSFLGRGWAFHPTFDDLTNDAKMVEKELDIRESLYILLSTVPGERIMHPDYGCGLHQLVFEPVDSNLYGKIRDRIEYAVLLYEPRIKLTGIDIEEVPGKEEIVYVTLNYLIKQTNSKQNMVYPMYFNGTQTM